MNYTPQEASYLIEALTRDFRTVRDLTSLRLAEKTARHYGFTVWADRIMADLNIEDVTRGTLYELDPGLRKMREEVGSNILRQAVEQKVLMPKKAE